MADVKQTTRAQKPSVKMRSMQESLGDGQENSNHIIIGSHIRSWNLTSYSRCMYVRLPVHVIKTNPDASLQ